MTTAQAFLPAFDIDPPGSIGEARARLRRLFGRLYVYDALVDLTRAGAAACMATNRRIAELLGLSASVVATHLRALEHLGLIERAAYPLVRSGRKILLRLAARRPRPAPPPPANDNCPVGYSTTEEPPPQQLRNPPLNDQCTPPSTCEGGHDSQVLESQELASPSPAPPNSIQFNSEVEDNVNVRVREGEGEEDPCPVEADPGAEVPEPLPADPPSGGEVPAARDDGSPSEEEIDRSSIEIWRHWVRTGHPFAGIGAKALRDRGLPPEPEPETPAPVAEVPPAPVVPPPASAPAPAPSPRPAPAPRPDVETILRRLRNPHFRNAVEEAATRLAEALDDFHSLPWLRRTCREVREGTIRFAALVRAFRAAMGARTSGGDPRKVFAATITRARKTDPGSP